MTSPSDVTPRDAKRPRSPLAGPYGHPFHPVLVTIPIGAWVASFVFDVVARAGGDEAVFSQGAYWLVGIGVVGALLAALFGLMDLLAIPRRTRAFTTGLTHMSLNLLVVAVFVVSFFLRAADGTDEATTAPFILTIVGLLVLGVSGWLGGKLAYRYGVRVADEGTQAEGF